ncbi:MAG: outer membrane beta-barrel protein, partial [Bryobacteraceae bacterium]
FSDWLSAQASYGWNRNAVVMSAGAAAGSYDFPVRATMHTVMAELLVYFRRRTDRLRPYLSVGTGFTNLRATPSGAPSVAGVIALPAGEFHSTGAGLRVAVGIDVALSHGLAFRYTFAETIQGNAISRRLTPPASRNLANFQNLWGVAWQF